MHLCCCAALLCPRSKEIGGWKKYGHRGLLGTHTNRYTVCLTTMHSRAVRSSDVNALGLAPKVESGIQVLFWEAPNAKATFNELTASVSFRPQVQALGVLCLEEGAEGNARNYVCKLGGVLPGPSHFESTMKAHFHESADKAYRC